MRPVPPGAGVMANGNVQPMPFPPHFPPPEVREEMNRRFFEMFESLNDEQRLGLVNHALEIRERVEKMSMQERMEFAKKMRAAGFPPPPPPEIIQFMQDYQEKHNK